MLKFLFVKEGYSKLWVESFEVVFRLSLEPCKKVESISELVEILSGEAKVVDVELG